MRTMESEKTMERIGIYPGTFDPVTNGHLDIIARASGLFDRIIFAVASENYKTPLFTMEERIELIREAVASLPNVEVESFDGLLADFYQKKNASAVIRGLRAISDFEREFQMALMNKQVLPDLETIFFMTAAQYQYVSSSIVKNFACYGKNVDSLVPPNVSRALQEKYQK